jgi:hypothetical protein
MSLGIGSAYAQGAPAGFQQQFYGSQAFSDHHNETATHFLGREIVLGRMLRYSSSNQVAATPVSAKRG